MFRCFTTLVCFLSITLPVFCDNLTPPQSIIKIKTGSHSDQLGVLSEGFFPDADGNNMESFVGPSSFAVDSNGQLFFLDSIHEEVAIFSATGKHIKNISLRNTPSLAQADFFDIQITSYNLPFLFDRQNHAIFFLTQNPKNRNTLKLPFKFKKEDVLFETMHLLQGTTFLLQDLQTRQLYSASSIRKKDSRQLLRPVLAEAETTLFPQWTASKKVAWSFKIDEKNPNRFLLIKYQDKKSEICDSITIQNLAHIVPVGLINHIKPVAAIFSGTAENNFLNMICSFSPEGKIEQKLMLKKTIPNWEAATFYRVANKKVYIMEHLPEEGYIQISVYSL